jgi:Ackermannviridae homing endonuclease
MAWPYEHMTWHVYLIENEVNRKRYVGITTKALLDRLEEHIADAMRGSPYALHAAIRKYGEDNFTIQGLKIADGLSAAQELECDYIHMFDTYASGPSPRRGYNMSYGGETPDAPWN